MKKNIKTIDWQWLIGIMVSFFLFLIFFSRSELVSIKIITLVILFVFNVCKFKSNLIKQYDRKIIIWVIIYVMLKFTFMVLGEVNGSDSFAYYWKIYLLEPILYTVVLFPSIKAIDTKKVDTALFCSFTCIIVLLSSAYIFFKVGLPLDFLLNLPATLAVNTDGNYIYISSMTIVSLFFLIPYFVSEFVFSKSPKRKLWSGVLLAVSLFLMIIVGRRALLAVVAIAVVLVIFLKYKREGLVFEKEKIKKAIAILGALALGMVTFLVFMGSELRFGSAGKEFINISDNIRIQQIFILLQSWMEHPILGVGYGINVDGYVRSDIPGMYEFSYIAMLAQTGMVGTIIHVVLVLYLLWEVYKIAVNEEQSHNLSVLVGVVCFLIGNFTNPYLYSFDGMWTLFYALALLNKNLLNNRGI